MVNKEHILRSLSELARTAEEVEGFFSRVQKEELTVFSDIVTAKPFKPNPDDILKLKATVKAQLKGSQLVHHALVRFWNDIRDVTFELEKKHILPRDIQENPEATGWNSLFDLLRIAKEAIQDLRNKVDPLIPGLFVYLEDAQKIIKTTDELLNSLIQSSEARLKVINELPHMLDAETAISAYTAARKGAWNKIENVNAILADIHNAEQKFIESQRVLRAAVAQFTPDARKRVLNAGAAGAIISIITFAIIFSDDHAIGDAFNLGLAATQASIVAQNKLK